MVWILRCTECGTVWRLEVSFDISDMDKVYHFCPYCRKNTFHVVIGKEEERHREEKSYKPDTTTSAKEGR